MFPETKTQRIIDNGPIIPLASLPHERTEKMEYVLRGRATAFRVGRVRGESSTRYQAIFCEADGAALGLDVNNAVDIMRSAAPTDFGNTAGAIRADFDMPLRAAEVSSFGTLNSRHAAVFGDMWKRVVPIVRRLYDTLGVEDGGYFGPPWETVELARTRITPTLIHTLAGAPEQQYRPVLNALGFSGLDYAHKDTRWRSAMDAKHAYEGWLRNREPAKDQSAESLRDTGSTASRKQLHRARTQMIKENKRRGREQPDLDVPDSFDIYDLAKGWRAGYFSNDAIADRAARNEYWMDSGYTGPVRRFDIELHPVGPIVTQADVPDTPENAAMFKALDNGVIFREGRCKAHLKLSMQFMKTLQARVEPKHHESVPSMLARMTWEKKDGARSWIDGGDRVTLSADRWWGACKDVLAESHLGLMLAAGLAHAATVNTWPKEMKLEGDGRAQQIGPAQATLLVLLRERQILNTAFLNALEAAIDRA